MKKLYLFILWQHNKSLFSLILFFIIGQAFFTYKQVETVPFFNYGMYSTPCLPQETYSTTSIYIDGQRSSLADFRQPIHFLQYQLNYYTKLYQNNGIDPVQWTINSRFGDNSSMSNYLYPLLSNSPQSKDNFERWIIQKSQTQNIQITQENFSWVKNNFKLVNKQQLY